MGRLGRGLALAAALLAVSEGLCRFWPAPGMGTLPAAASGEETVMNGSPWLLWELIPGDHLERGGHVHVNALGMRDRDRGPKTGPRAMAVGDSSVYGFGNDDAEVFTAVLEARTGVDFVNAAVPGYSSFQVLNLLRGRALALDPDLLLVGTIWSDNNFDSFVDKELLASYAGWEAGAAGRVRAVLTRSALFNRLDWQLRVRDRAAEARTVGWQVGGDVARDGNRRVSLADYAANLDTFCRLMAERGGGVVYLLLANREDIRPVSHDPAWKPYREAMRTAAERCEAPLVDVPAAFRASGRSADELFLDLMHPTRTGHAVLADAVAATLAAAGWPTTPLLARPTREPLPALADRFEGHGKILESSAERGAGVDIELRGAPPGTLIVALNDAADTGGVALGSVTMQGDGLARVQLRARPERVVVDVTLDRAGDGPTEGDPHATLGPFGVPATGPLIVELGPQNAAAAGLW